MKHNERGKTKKDAMKQFNIENTREDMEQSVINMNERKGHGLKWTWMSVCACAYVCVLFMRVCLYMSARVCVVHVRVSILALYFAKHYTQSHTHKQTGINKI